MKKVFIMMGAVLSFGIASAQTDPKQPPQAPDTPPTPVTTDMTPADADQKDPNAQTTVIEKSVKRDKVQPRKAELKTRDHVKSTPNPERVRDTAKTSKKKAKRNKRG